MVIYCDELNFVSAVKILRLLKRFPHVKEIVLLGELLPSRLFSWFEKILSHRGVSISEKKFFAGYVFYEDGESVMSRSLKMSTEMSFKEAAKLLSSSPYLTQLDLKFKKGTVNKILASSLYDVISKVMPYMLLVDYFEREFNREAVLVVAAPFHCRQMTWMFVKKIQVKFYTPSLLGKSSYDLATKGDRVKRIGAGIILKAGYLILKGIIKSYRERKTLSYPIPNDKKPRLLMLQDDEIGLDPSYRVQPHWLIPGTVENKWQILIIRGESYNKSNALLNIQELSDKGVFLINEEIGAFFRAWQSGESLFQQLKESYVKALRLALLGSSGEKAVLSDVITVLFKALLLGRMCREMNIAAFVSCENYKADTEAMCLISDELGVKTASFQYSNQGFLPPGMVSTANVMLFFSSFFHSVWNRFGLCSERVVDVGYLYSSSIQLLKERASRTQEELRKKGASFIICYFDENCTKKKIGFCSFEKQGHEFERLFRLLIEDTSIGLVIKTQFVHNLPEQFTVLNDLRQQALLTGRYIELKCGVLRNTVLPAEAALIADITIGHHTGATASLEAAITGKRSVLINSCGRCNIQDALYARSRIVYRDLESVLIDIQKFRRDNSSVNDMGDWSGIVKEFDPFLDGKAAIRFAQALDSLTNKS